MDVASLRLSEDRGQMSEDPSSLFELGASPFGLRPHKTPRHAEVRRQVFSLLDALLNPGSPLRLALYAQPHTLLTLPVSRTLRTECRAPVFALRAMRSALCPHPNTECRMPNAEHRPFKSAIWNSQSI